MCKAQASTHKGCLLPVACCLCCCVVTETEVFIQAQVFCGGSSVSLFLEPVGVALWLALSPCAVSRGRSGDDGTVMLLSIGAQSGGGSGARVSA